MRIKEIKYMQEGGQMGTPVAAPVEGGAPAEMGGAPQGGEDQLAALAGQLLEALLQQLGDPQAVMAVLETAMQMLQEAAGQGQPVFKKGGVLAKKGCKMAKKK
jgi:hypothetical protein